LRYLYVGLFVWCSVNVIEEEVNTSLVSDGGGVSRIGVILYCETCCCCRTFVFIAASGFALIYPTGRPSESNCKIKPSGQPSKPYQGTRGSSVHQR